MTITKAHYVAILKWRLGEYQALSRLDGAQKDLITPLIVIPPIEYDFELKCLKKTAQEHIETFPNRLLTKWSTRKAIIDIHDSLEHSLMDSGSSVISYIFEELLKRKSNAIPVVSLKRSSIFFDDIKTIIKQSGGGIAIRVYLADLIAPSLNVDLESVITNLGVSHDNIDLIIDIGKPDTFEPYADFSKALLHRLTSITNLKQFRSFVFTATGLNITKIKPPGAEVVRHEWLLYQKLANDLKAIRVPSYGDYAIETPEFSEMDMRTIKPAGKIIYTGDSVWFVSKGSAFRGNEAQMIKLCEEVMSSAHWEGKGYSHGDERIHETQAKIKNTGNLSTWKQVGVSHHLVKVVHQLAKFHAS